MKKLFLTILLCLLITPIFAPNIFDILIFESKPIVYIPKHKLKIIKAIIEVEMPRSYIQAVEAVKRETATGNLQIRDVMLNEVNRLIGFECFKPEDRFDDNKSIQMFIVYQDYYNPSWDYKKAALLWNMGSNYKKATIKQKKKGEEYWIKVKKHIKN